MPLFSQEGNFPEQCAWLELVMNSEDKADQLKLIKANQIGFRTNWETNQPLDSTQCGVLIKLQVNDKDWALTPSYVRDPQAVLEAIREK